VNLITVDYETFWTKEHSLSKMLPMTYVMHPQTQIISCAVKIDDEPTEVWFGEDNIAEAFKSIQWDDAMVIGHNMSGFDAMIHAWRFGIHPKMWGCTLAMAKPIHAITVGNSLAKLVEHYQLGVKDNSVLVATQGKRLEDFTADELAQMSHYNKADTDQCFELFKRLRPQFSRQELWHIDATIRMLVEPKFVVDKDMLGAALLGERNRKYEAVMNLAELLDLDIEGDTSKIEEEVTTQLASAAKFSEILENRGVPVPMKDSPSTEGKQIPALAKTDPGFIALQEHDDDIVAAAALARLAIKSTILETRINTFLEVADTANGMLPVPLNYCGATTTGRDSGWIYNPQNLPRVNPKQSKLSDALRNCMKAPEGYSVVVADLSGIELRVNHFLWKVDSTMELYQNDPQADLYRAAGAQVHGRTAEEVTKDQRQIEKIKALGLGFGAGASTFVRIAKTMGGMDITLDQAQDWVSQWRSQYRDIVEGWKTCGKVLQDIRDGIERDIDPWGLCKTNAQGILLPSGRLIRYPKLRTEEGGTWDDGRSKSSWVYGEGRHKTFLTGPKVDENIVQALARDVLKDYKVQIFAATRHRSVLDVHDELVYIVPTEQAKEHLDTVQSIMRTPPKWWPELITWSEGSYNSTYGLAK